MATIRLVPSQIYNGASSYLTISNPENAYYNTDHTAAHATIQNTYASTSSRYAYISGFNFSDIPSGAVVSEFTVKIRGYESGISTSTSYAPSLANGTSAITNTTASSTFGTSTKVITVPTGALTWEQIVGYGSNFGIRVNARRRSRNTTGYLYIQGAEIEVTYTIPNPRTVTISGTGSGDTDPEPGTYTYYDGDEFELIITPTNSSDTVTATVNGSSVELTQHSGGQSTEEAVLGAYALVSGGFNGSGATYFSGLVGKGHTASQTTTNYYSSGNGTIAVWTYDIELPEIPESATITSLYMLVNGHAESTSQSSEYMCARLISGSTNLSDELNFKDVGTSNSTQTVTANVMPTAAQLAELKVQCRLGYYGGAINGATVYLEYEVAGVYYTYSTTISGDMTIVVTIGGGSSGPYLYIKENGTWVQYTKVYKKINGTWVEQRSSTWSTLFSTSANYVKG